RPRTERQPDTGARRAVRGRARGRGGGGRGPDRVHRHHRPARHPPPGRQQPRRRHPDLRATGRGAAGPRRPGLPLHPVPVRDPDRHRHGADRRPVLPLPGPSSEGGGVMAVLSLPAARRRGVRVSLPVLLAGLGAVAVLLSVYGAHLPVADALKAAVGVHNPYSALVQDSQLPRVMLCWVVGASLGVAGGVTQAVVRNPLASPDVIGVSKGAAVGAALMLLVLPTAPIGLVPVAAFAGGLIAFFAIYLFAYKRGASPVRLAVTGIAVGAVGDAAVRFMLVKWPTNINAALVWLVGSLYGRGRQDVFEALPWAAVLIPAILLCAHRLDVLSLGDDLATGLGER